MELRVLGPLEAHGPQGRVELRPVERRLLSALVACRPATAGCEALAEAVWPDRVPPSAKHSLQTHVMRIRRSLGRDCVVTADGGYRLGPSLHVDVDIFEEMGRLARGAGEPATRLAAWDNVLSSWRGVPFAEIEDWPPAVAVVATDLPNGRPGTVGAERSHPAMGVGGTAWTTRGTVQPADHRRYVLGSTERPE